MPDTALPILNTWAPVLVSGYLAGLVASILPCNLAMLPIVAGYAGADSNALEDTPTRSLGLLKELLLFIMGMALTFSVLGLMASVLGLTFGFWLGPWLYAGLGLLAILLGMQMLGWIQLALPGLTSRLPERKRLPLWLQGLYPLFLGILFGLVASPCGTPFLLGLLTLTAKSQTPVLGGLALFAYALGQGSLLLLVGLGAGWLRQRLLFLREAGRWLNVVSALLFIGMGLWWLWEALSTF